MNEKVKNNELTEKEIKEQKIIEKENKIIKFLVPIVGAIAFVLGLLGFILTLGRGNNAVTVFYIVLFVLGLLGGLYGVFLLIRKKNPNFLRKKKEEQTDTLLD